MAIARIKLSLATALLLLAIGHAAAQGSGGDPPFIPAAETRADLMSLYSSLGGESWTHSDGWGSDTDHCTWYGVVCLEHDHNQTTQLSLKSNNLVGELPLNMGHGLGDLKTLDLSGNAISGPIPESISSITQLRFLYLQNNKLQGPLPKFIYNYKVNCTYPVGSVMREIDLSYNALDGTIPETWFGPPQNGTFPPPNNLQVINLMYNKLQGTIPKTIATALKLTSLLMSYNELSGNLTDETLATWLGTRKYCSLDGNKFQHVAPEVEQVCFH